MKGKNRKEEDRNELVDGMGNGNLVVVVAADDVEEQVDEKDQEVNRSRMEKVWEVSERVLQ